MTGRSISDVSLYLYAVIALLITDRVVERDTGKELRR
jgi:hypothetical protein